MEYKGLGTSDITVSRIGFGCMSLKVGAVDNQRLLHAALDKGINFFDTADLYDKGGNEEILGKAFAKRRGEVLIATKVGNRWRSDGSGWDWHPQKEYILQAAEQSLRRLQTDYIDLYQLHGGTIDDPIEDVIEAFEMLKQQGKIRQYGISSIRPNVIRRWVGGSQLKSIMMQYSLLDRRPEETVLDIALQHKVGVLVRGAVAQGLLAGKPAKAYLKFTEQEVSDVQTKIAGMAGSKRSSVQASLQYVLRHPAVTSAVVGIRSEEQLTEIVEALHAKFSNEEMDDLFNNLPVLRYEEHR